MGKEYLTQLRKLIGHKWLVRAHGIYGGGKNMGSSKIQHGKTQTIYFRILNRAK